MINTTTNGTYFLDVNGDVKVGGNLTIAAGTATKSPIDFTAGALKTTTVAGDLEVDTNAYMYYSAQAASRGIVLTEQLITLTTAYTTPLGVANSLKQLFDTSTNGALTVVGNTTYFFECAFIITSMSASSGTFSFGFGGSATISSIAYICQGLKGGTTDAAAISNVRQVSTAQVIGLSLANNSTTGWAFIQGKIIITTGGTITPAFSLSVAAAAVNNAGAWFKLKPVGTNTVTTVGNWS